MLSVSLEAWSFKYSQVENKLSNIQDQTKTRGPIVWVKCILPQLGTPPLLLVCLP